MLVVGSGAPLIPAYSPESLFDLNPMRGSRGFMGVGISSMHPKETIHVGESRSSQPWLFEPGFNRAVKVRATDAWRHYFSPVMQMIIETDHGRVMHRDANTFVPIERLDIELSVHPAVASPLFNEQWDLARRMAF